MKYLLYIKRIAGLNLRDKILRNFQCTKFQLQILIL